MAKKKNKAAPPLQLTPKLESLFDALTKLQQEFASIRIAHPEISDADVYKACKLRRSKGKLTQNALKQGAHRLVTNSNVKKFLKAYQKEQRELAIAYQEQELDDQSQCNYGFSDELQALYDACSKLGKEFILERIADPFSPASDIYLSCPSAEGSEENARFHANRLNTNDHISAFFDAYNNSPFALAEKREHRRQALFSYVTPIRMIEEEVSLARREGRKPELNSAELNVARLCGESLAKMFGLNEADKKELTIEEKKAPETIQAEKAKWNAIFESMSEEERDALLRAQLKMEGRDW